MSKKLSLSDLKLKDLHTKEQQPVRINQVPAKDIAIIGMAGIFSGADDLAQFWANLRAGRDCIRPFPASREVDTSAYLAAIGREQVKYHEGGYLEEIDKFDPLFFKISPKEASLMDPNQRIFLETAYKAIEDAGYGGKQLAGTKTGVYVGFSSDTSVEYRKFVSDIEPESVNISVPGNVKSIIASRIAYFLDLKGPAMLVDTACSSALVAVHLACSDLQNRRSEMALVGGIKLTLMPVNVGQNGWLNIRSSISRARTFDDSSDGTGMGEGAGVIVLKPLAKALEDKDHIYAVIKGSAVNQDGTSIGITAPNSLAQAEVIEAAWLEAEVDPATITYIEAHGTGTPLGDPIEIDGITRAFRKYTAKKQFCAVGAVKTNIGHTDNLAGIAGLIKAVLALQHRELPPTVHFAKPNQKIKFIESPLYLLDRLTPWETDGLPRRCGVSSFGLSGTNCHVVLEEAPAVFPEPDHGGLHIFTLSGKTPEVLADLVSAYRKYIREGATVSLQDICYTANTGRSHFTQRLAILCASRAELASKLEQLENALLKCTAAAPEQLEGIYWGEHRVVAQKRTQGDIEITGWEQKELGSQANLLLQEINTSTTGAEQILSKLGRLYITGADIDWLLLYRGQNCRRVPLPVYPFERKRCWLEAAPTAGTETLPAGLESKYVRTLNHPLLDVCLAESMTQDIYLTGFSVERHWVLKEHRVQNHYLVPGTTYLELARALAENYFPGLQVRLEDVYFLTPLIVEPGEVKEVQTIVQKAEDRLEFVVASRDGSERWVKHAEGKISGITGSGVTRYEPAALKARFAEEILVSQVSSGETAVATGPRWRNLTKIYPGTTELLAEVQLPAAFHHDLQEYTLHPAMLDMAVNVVTQRVGQGLYLPLNYKSFELYQPMPGKFYSYLVRKDKGSANLETVTFDIELLDESGTVFASIRDYTIKKVHQTDLKGASTVQSYYETGWVLTGGELVRKDQPEGDVLVLLDSYGHAAKLLQQLAVPEERLIEVEFGAQFAEVRPGKYVTAGSKEEFLRLLEGRNITQVLYFAALTGEPVLTLQGLQEQQKRGVEGLFALTRALLQAKVNTVDLVLVVDYANRVTGEEKVLHPHNAALLGLAKVVSQEYVNLHCRCIDFDAETPLELITAEIAAGAGTFIAAYRQSERYTPEFRKLELATRPSLPLEISEDGVYLITGGTGGLGLEIARFLARDQRVKLALVNRTPLPVKAEWPQIIAAGTDAKLCHKLRSLQELEASGAEVTCYQADVANLQAMEALLSELRARYGRIRGIVHAAGVAGDGFILLKDRQVFENVLAPKIYGTWILNHLTQKDKPDFFLLFSSITAVLGGPGQGDYTAANSYLDAFAAAGVLQGQRIISINWPAWKETGMAVEYGVNHDQGIFRAISTDPALRALEQILQRSIASVLVAELNYGHEIFARDQFGLALAPGIKAEIERYRKRTGSRESKRTTQTVNAVLKGRKEGEYSSTEITLANVWAQVLGLEEVDVFEDFYSLGGDSILAIRITNSINSALQKKIDISDLFQYLTIAQLAAFLDGQTAERTAVKEPEAVQKSAQVMSYDLTNAQKRIWFMQKFDPQMTAYNLPSILRITDGLDIPLLTGALQKLVKRHSALRTIFTEEKGVPKQVIVPEIELPVELVDLQSEPEVEETLKQLLAGENRKVFDLTKPLVKVKVYRLSEREYLIYINIHHLITDGWSMRVFSEELLELYRAGLIGAERELPPVPLQYTDWMAAQQQWMQSEECRSMEEYWLSELLKPLPVLNLPTDYPRPQRQTYNGSYYPFRLNSEDTARLKVIARESNSTMHMLLLSVYYLLLHKLSGDEELIVGIPMTGRDQQELEKVFGLFINNICLRINFADIETFTGLLKLVKEKSLAGYRNSKYPFDLLVMKLNPERDFSRHPIFSTLFQFYGNIPQVNENISLFELSMLSREVNGEIEARFEYNTDLFSRETVVRLSGYFTNLIQQISTSPAQAVAELTLLSPREKAALEQSFSRIGEMPLPEGQVQQFFELQAERRPEAIALHWQGEILTYRELNRRANQLAHFLKAQGLQLEEPVGIMLGRGMEMIVGMLGILKAGGAYVPLDPEYPADRISYMLQHSAARFLITGHEVLSKATASGENQIRIVVDLTGNGEVHQPGMEYVYHWADLASQSTENLRPAGDGRNLMYIIYTSGSTGLPKGVMVSHANALNYLLWSIRDGSLGFEDGMMLVTSMSFDISVFEIFGALLSGASLSIVPAEVLRDGSSLLEYLEAQPVNIWHSVPTLMSQVLLAARNRRSRYSFWTRIRRIMIGGEAWSAELAREISEYFPAAEIVNMYGPTEATIWVMSYRVCDVAKLTTLPIGRPVTNNQILILDTAGQLCAPGIPGDIYVSGANVTRGYYKDPDKTAQVFIKDANGQIRYKTGDLGRYLPDGTVEYLGRKDGMVKVRGYRIELGEIENVLTGHPEILSAAAITKPEGDSNKLICYYTALGAPATAELREFLSQKLPLYMLPAHLVQLDAMPLTPNGKIDKKSLAGLEVSIRPEQVSNISNSADTVEQFLLTLWQELLGTEVVSTYDNFFTLGGNSFLVNQMHARIEERYPDRITIVDIFTYPTIEKLAEYLRQEEELRASEAGPAEPGGEENVNLDDELLNLFAAIEKGDLSVEEATKKIADLEVKNE